MNFTHFNMGHLEAGAVIEVTLKGTAANVRLLDSSNFSAFRAGRQHRYVGGYVTRSPVHLTVPRSGSWHVTIDLGGYRGSVKSGVRVLPGRLPTMRQIESPLSRLVNTQIDEAPVVGDDQATYDVFISHASEDKDSVVRELAVSLQAQGLRVWYDEFTLRIGDSLRRKIDAGIARSRFGVVVLSNAFFSKGWTQYELDGLVSRQVNGEQVILPLWHGIGREELLKFSPSLADKLARSTSEHNIQQIAEEIATVIQLSVQSAMDKY